MILITGGAGYIGSHTCIELLQSDNNLLVLDNLSNASIESLNRVARICDVELIELSSKNFESCSYANYKFSFINGDIRDADLIRSIFTKFDIEAVVHFAGLKAVGESVEKPLTYFDNNVSGSVNLLKVMSEYGCKNLVFSSSATVYGEPQSLPIKENFPLSTTNPYGASKLMVEGICVDLANSDLEWSIILLRYFNPVGAHESGLIGEDPNGVPNNLMPFISQVAIGHREYLNVFGNNYPTPDGTGIRDYIHVVDLAKGHLKALQALQKNKGVLAVNLGTGEGYSVLEMVKSFEAASNKTIKYKVVEPRSGDVAECYADPSFALKVLGWKASLDINKMCEDAWRWQLNNPSGYTKV